jgi:16S rRNA G966 N2-methylase RsmD
MLSLVEYFSNPGEHVIDPFAGSGTTGLAASILRRKFTGAELDSEWVYKANARIAASADLSARDTARYNRWTVETEKVRVDKERLKKHTAKIRAKFEAAK